MILVVYDLIKAFVLHICKFSVTWFYDSNAIYLSEDAK